MLEGCLKVAAISVFIVLGLFVGLFFLPHSNGSSHSGAAATQYSVSDSQPPKNQSASETTTSTSVQRLPHVTDLQLLHAYSDNQIAADAKYCGREIVLSGHVDTVGHDMMSGSYIMMTEPDTMNYVMCYVDVGQRAALALLHRGQLVSVIGTCAGRMEFVTLNHCQLIP